MGLDWTEPFKIAFELFMFGLGWLLVVVIAAFFLFLTYAIVFAFVKTVRDRRKGKSTGKNGIITFDKK